MKTKQGPPRFRPGTVADREIRRYQERTKRIIRGRSFRRVCREVLQDIQATKEVGDLIRTFNVKAVEALQEAAEDYLYRLFKSANEELVENRDEVTLKEGDMRSAVNLEAREREQRQMAFEEKREAMEIDYAETIESRPPLPSWEIPKM